MIYSRKLNKNVTLQNNTLARAISSVKIGIALVLSCSFILSNLDVIEPSKKIDNWFSVSSLIDKVRGIRNQKKYITEAQANKYLIIKIEDSILENNINNYVRQKINQILIEKSNGFEKFKIIKKSCPTLIGNILSTKSEKIECELKTVVAKSVVYEYKGKYVLKDYSVDNLFIKKIEPLLDTIDNVNNIKLTKFNENYMFDFGEPKLDYNNLLNLTLKKSWILYSRDVKIKNKLYLKNCENNTFLEISKIQSSFDCKEIIFKVNDMLVKNGNDINRINYEVSDIVLYNYKMKI